MNKTTLTTVLSVALIGSFFMPFFYWHSFEMNGFNFILSEHIPSYKYLLLLIPFAAAFHLFNVLTEGNYFFSQKLLSLIPLITVAAVFMIVFFNKNADPEFFEAGNIFSNIGSGFWLALSLSLLLAFVKRRKDRTSFLEIKSSF